MSILRNNRWPAVLPVLALVAGLVVWLRGWHLGADSAVYRAGAATLLKGEPLYSADLTTLPDWVRLPFTYPPAATLTFVPLALVPSGLTWGVATALSVASVTVVLAVAGRLRGAWLAVATLGALLLEPVWKTLFLGQINLILMALVVVDALVLCARGSRLGGTLIGVAAAVKLTPLIFVPYLLFTGRWRDALRALGMFAGLQAVMFVIAPRDAADYWGSAVFDPDRIGSVHWIFNQSLNGMVNRASALAPWSTTAALAVGALLAVPAVWLVVRFHRRGEPVEALLVAAFYGLLLSPVSWSHHWVWAIPLVVLLVRTGRRWWAAAAVVLFGSQVVMLVPNGGGVEFGWGLGWGILGNAYVLAAAVGIVGLAAREVRLLVSVERSGLAK
ncbi:glycosyltransferase 87 family protein [Amycolatopsis panacis]|uniref:DUF2029 domain-containing protein n=1 Tax=Amycolatopsis panacis TaxID=2340917 RepID=A0A419I112_9PSEU|nr:glycosyltransferase 87 family protein [Amycolatopsis panacis]RJQ83226.1 DUF2029 domain-containing protein [Amycolatopsis panacis]